MPAVRRYLSPRIRVAEEAAAALGWNFAILSGLYGLLDAEAPLAYYDHLLTSDQEHAARCAAWLVEWAPGTVVMLSRREAVDPGVGPYRACLEAACARAGVVFRLVEIGAETPDAEDMAGLLRNALG